MTKRSTTDVYLEAAITSGIVDRETVEFAGFLDRMTTLQKGALARWAKAHLAGECTFDEMLANWAAELGVVQS